MSTERPDPPTQNTPSHFQAMLAAIKPEQYMPDML
jgi:hypothetical protein